MSDKQHCGFGTDGLFGENRLPHTKLQPLLLRRKRWFEERIRAQYIMKPKEEISGFNFDLIHLCYKYHDYVMDLLSWTLFSLMKKFVKCTHARMKHRISQVVADDEAEDSLNSRRPISSSSLTVALIN